MGLRLLLGNALVIGGVLWMLAAGTETRAAMLLPDAAGTRGLTATGASTVGALETEAALDPGSAAVAELATAYLERDQPGLASAVIEKAPRAVRERPEIAHLEARALFHRGRARQALALARDVQASCDGDRCAPWLVAKSTRHLAFLEEVVAAGIDDPELDRAATRAAYDRSAREVRLVAMR
jgi:hypothetical protein